MDNGRSMESMERGSEIRDDKLDSSISFRLEWHRPAITRINLKRTLNYSGSHSDGMGGTTTTP
jgi:hypothetical protein